MKDISVKSNIKCETENLIVCSVRALDIGEGSAEKGYTSRDKNISGIMSQVQSVWKLFQWFPTQRLVYTRNSTSISRIIR